MSDPYLSDASRIIAGVVLLTIVTIEIGGWFMTKIARGAVEMTPFQKSFARAGHGHAGVLVILSLITLVLADLGGLDGAAGWVARICVPAAAAVMSGGFFAASAGRDRTEPNGAIAMVYLGALLLAVGVATLGIGLLTA
ncbi:hypothetical protein BJY16_002592 [Actinoplanes octamycinicus]|uniref:Integral membrane protein n=1 Tax=Actinoplanes octamycinicus TaxID=135948 RepID=A0A7W7GVP8_9ACTN|nr:hypothetical protein [Actinoplanes octamycinicus]MBB4739133.1 hypothetical protein [Actinoplanes octamycinicus]GIE58892.1 hypothetical protein Aoc01nite_42940 [Actinoplanes octamycinicus]